MNPREIIDISWPISEAMTEYKNKKVVTLAPTKQFERDGVRESVVTLGTHTGTHVDAPSHFLKDGITIDQLPLTSLAGPCSVIDLTHLKEKITAQDLQPLDIAPHSIILFKTANSTLAPTASFNTTFVYLDAAAALYLANLPIKTIGTDYLGIERAQPEHETHRCLFEKNITVIEGLRLGHVTPGNYFFCCFPLALQGLEAAPARAVLFQPR